MSASADPIVRDRRRMRRRAGLALAALLTVAAAAIVAILFYAASERERLIEQWQVRLGIVADSRKAAVEGWLDHRRGELLRLSRNRAIQYYLIDLTDPDLPPEALDSRRRYIEELLGLEAERGGYATPQSEIARNADLDTPATGGVAVLDADLQVIALSPGMSFVKGIMPAAPPELLQGGVFVSPVYPAGDGERMVTFLAPVLSPDGGTEAGIGYVVAFRRLGDDFDATLRQPGEVLREARTYLLESAEGGPRLISPLEDGPPLFAAVSGAESVATLTATAPASGTYRGLSGREVLATGRGIAGTGWTLVRSVDREAALAEGVQRIQVIAGALMLVVLLVGVTVVAVWRNAISDRLAAAASDLSEALAESRRLGRLLKNLADAVPNSIVAVGPDDRILFGNTPAFEGAGIDAAEAEGKPIASIFGPAVATPLVQANARVRQDNEIVHEIDDTEIEGRRRVVRRFHVPLDAGGVLMVAEDMTEIVQERERRAAQLDALVDVLVNLIDARDRYAANHSQRVAHLSRRMAEEMKLEPAMVHAAETAARLMNLGKLGIDPAILTKSGDLTEDELALVRDSILHSADLVANIDFEGPVVETLRQLQERLDGSGRPAGISGPDFLQPAQIVSLANAYVALISERAHRAARTTSQALDQLWPQAGKVWDRQVVAALVQAVERGGD
ncbi:HD domain-containing phosphohydrolase [Minwuia thermotolerans]|uniref:HD-GYP domain-containing protein n=1 Tax=Minwuia thermotolerans TaxID=2056226 RepID=A0A2M9FXU3_9PROT|nr:HD domain-containing phosphohydrolase [Minwuia thermotolerans]PJK28277.1 hypothetical protein CVT23_18055 [Minwuia thermotolerans]